MCPNGARKAVAHLDAVVDLVEACNRAANGKAVEDDVFDPHNGGALRQNARCTAWSNEALRGQRYAGVSFRRAQRIDIAHIGKPQIVRRPCAEGLHIAQREHLRQSQIRGVKARNVCASLLNRIRVVHRPIVGKIECRQGSNPRIFVDPHRRFFVVQSQGLRGSREFIVPLIGRRNVLNKILRRT